MKSFLVRGRTHCGCGPKREQESPRRNLVASWPCIGARPMPSPQPGETCQCTFSMPSIPGHTPATHTPPRSAAPWAFLSNENVRDRRQTSVGLASTSRDWVAKDVRQNLLPASARKRCEQPGAMYSKAGGTASTALAAQHEEISRSGVAFSATWPITTNLERVALSGLTANTTHYAFQAGYRQKQSRPDSNGPAPCYPELPNATSIVPLLRNAVTQPREIDLVDFALLLPRPVDTSGEPYTRLDGDGRGSIVTEIAASDERNDDGTPILPARTIRVQNAWPWTDDLAETVNSALKFISALGYKEISLRFVTGAELNRATELYWRAGFLDMHSVHYANERKKAPHPAVPASLRNERFSETQFALVEVAPACLWLPHEFARWFHPTVVGAYDSESQAVRFNNEYAEDDETTIYRIGRVSTGESIAVAHELFHAVQKAIAPQFWTWSHSTERVQEFTQWIHEGTAIAIAIAKWVERKGLVPTDVARHFDAYIGRRLGRGGLPFAADPIGADNRATSLRTDFLPACDVPVQANWSYISDPNDMYMKGALFYCANDGDVRYIRELYKRLESAAPAFAGPGVDNVQFALIIDLILADAGGRSPLVPPFRTTDGETLAGLKGAYVRYVLAAAHYSPFYTDDQNRTLAPPRSIGEDGEERTYLLKTIRHLVCAGGGSPDESCGIPGAEDDQPYNNRIQMFCHVCRAYVAAPGAGNGLLEFTNLSTDGQIMVLQSWDGSDAPIVTRTTGQPFVASRHPNVPVSLTVINLAASQAANVFQVRVRVQPGIAKGGAAK